MDNRPTPTPAPWISPAEAAEALRTGTGRGVRIAVLDSGIDWRHYWLRRLKRAGDVVVRQEEGRLVGAPGKGEDVFGHGTAVAWIIHSLAPEAEIMSIRVLDEGNHARSEIICEGAEQALDHGAHILNCSFGARLRQQVLMFKSWTDRAYLEQRHVVAACNNEDFRRPEWPGDFTSVITVNMVSDVPPDALVANQPGALVEFAALGVGLRVPWLDGRWAIRTGSSFAAPRVTALLARLLSVFPGLSPWEAKSLLLRVARPAGDFTAPEPEPVPHPGMGFPAPGPAMPAFGAASPDTGAGQRIP
ncbi:MAG: alkaline serine protease [Verrucomicrobiaceae bacterium]|nr:MAG: alkaline serine protease [Verrucomicrobiaceae bacterium]